MEFTYIGNQDKKDVRLTGSFANGAFVTANSAASFANAAFDRANAAFLQANTSGGGGSSTPVTIYSDVFTANGNTSTFNLSTSPEDENYIIAVVDGITQLRSTYTVTGNVVTFDSAFDNGANVEITTITGGGESPYAANHANLAYAQANAAFTQANNSTDTWVRTQANSAFDKANSAGSFANSSFVTANASYDQANTGALFANGAFITANSAAAFANGSFVTANTASSFSNAAFTQANTAVDLATAAFIQANAAFAQANNSTDTWVRTQANSAFDAANSSGSFANGAFVTANSGASFANGAFDRANAAYAQANNSTDTWVRTQANNAYDTANSAQTFANAAFITANSAASFANGAFAAANLKFNTSGGTISGDVSITGNLSILGNAFSTSATQIVANDTLFIMGTGNYSGDVLDIGFSSHYNDGTNAHTGIIRDAGTKEWHVFEGYTPEVGANNSIDINHASFKIATLQANLKSTTITIKGIDLLPYVNNAYATANSGASFANSAFITANASYESQNTTASFANGAFITANAAFNAANNATDPWVRNQANNSYNTANGAFVTANSGASFANGAFDRANAAYAAANTGSGVGGVLTSFVDTFTANGISNNFTLSTTPTNKNITFVSIQGVLQPKESYNISGTILTFDSTPPNTAFIEITTLNGASDNAAFITANAAFITANSGASFANAAFIQANAAFTQANTASIRYITLNETGNIVIKTGTVRFYPPSNIAINNVYASLSTTSANTFTFEVVKNGSVVGTYNIDSNTNKMTVAAANINLTSNDYLTVNITNGSQASDLRIDLEYK